MEIFNNENFIQDVNTLNEYDFKLLEFLKDNKDISLKEILKKFPDKKFGTKYRLYLLSATPWLSNSWKHSRTNSSLSYIKEENYILEKDIDNKICYSLSSKGYKILIDYKASKRKNFLKYLDNFIFRLLPLMISAFSAFCSYLVLTT